MSDYIDEYLSSQVPPDDLQNIVAYLMEEIKKLKQSKPPLQTIPPLAADAVLIAGKYIGGGASLADSGTEDDSLTAEITSSLVTNNTTYLTINSSGTYLITGSALIYRPSSTNQTSASVVIGEPESLNRSVYFGEYWPAGASTADQRFCSGAQICYLASGAQLVIRCSVGAGSPTTQFSGLFIGLVKLSDQVSPLF